ncbi:MULTISPECIES: aldolase/citrate lyase family protein [Pseudoxanthomonas]|uniref:(S)-citramalyl-CoA lyase n=1 Tax=Pseudoxanthomonas winnipegensis TaxID=2480810 RepID=A0AAW8GA61_9GAMM|nr:MULTISPECIES: aldolase/citrate lyase family protein [Pseudoxanthomonas]MDQ1119083.1 (S)-citramalyl-CoA lyase [Pseudoxanthomonas winnipegensis]MDQ1132273.1 (S)-citramalyl-CoA lyase [Pseudoxanthomonas winnipegensis]MDR6137714.1 (S)-citramalyl-CoA lyase [Pseudoxanthomonas sp. SORGH_AS_0997]
MIRTRSWLFTPGSTPTRFHKAREVGADVMLLDLEDAVSPDGKAAARRATLEFLSTPGHHRIGRALRINGLDTVHGLADLQSLLKLAPSLELDYIVLPKVESAGHVVILDRLLTAAGHRAQVLALVESAKGLIDIDAICGSSERLFGVMLGAADMAADLGGDTSTHAMSYARSRIVCACAAAGIAAIDSPFFAVDNDQALATELASVSAMGFVGKAAIHPSQVAPINATWTPGQQEVLWAQAVLDTNARGVGLVQGKMVDEAVARRARRILSRADPEAISQTQSTQNDS